MDHGLDMVGLCVLAGFIGAWSLASAWLQGHHVSAPMAAVAVGMLVANEPLSWVHVSAGSEAVRELAEITLAVVLFGDAATVSLRKLRRDAGLEARLLLGALPFTVALGTVAAHALVDTSWPVSAVIGAAVAPTDAALGGAIFGDERVPPKVRRLLNVESGLNDGIATPIVNFFLVVAVSGTAYEGSSEAGALKELLVGVALGAIVGGFGGLAAKFAVRSGVATESSKAVGTAAMAVFAYAVVVQIGGNGFVAAFVAGLAFGATGRGSPHHEGLEFTHQTGDVLSMAVWLIFGALAWPILGDAAWEAWAFAVLALTVVRMAPVVVALIGSPFDRATTLLVAWFGPRGLASVVFALLAFDALAPEDGQQVLTVIACTVVVSVVAHGATTAWMGSRFAAVPPVQRSSGVGVG